MGHHICCCSGNDMKEGLEREKTAMKKNLETLIDNQKILLKRKNKLKRAGGKHVKKVKKIPASMLQFKDSVL